MSDMHLHNARSVVARAAAPKGAGKDPNLVLLAYDGHTGTLDPAFNAHALPLLNWATAWWDAWWDTDQLTNAFTDATAKINRAKRSSWDVVTGPVTTLVASFTTSDPSSTARSHESRTREQREFMVRYRSRLFRLQIIQL